MALESGGNSQSGVSDSEVDKCRVLFFDTVADEKSCRSVGWIFLVDVIGVNVVDWVGDGMEWNDVELDAMENLDGVEYCGEESESVSHLMRSFWGRLLMTGVVVEDAEDAAEAFSFVERCSCVCDEWDEDDGSDW